MFIITNRRVDENKTKVKDVFSKRPSEKGPNELRLAQATKGRKGWSIKVLPNKITKSMAEEAGLTLEAGQDIYSSEYVAHRLKREMVKDKGRNLLLYVHGFNNDMDAVLKRAAQLEKTYNVEVLIYSWPANGGGIKGVASYRSDKQDALASVGAFNRVLERMSEIVSSIHRRYVNELESKANERFSDDAEAWDRFFSASVTKRCPFTINLMLHSMGNYLYKHLLSSSVYNGERLLFDNIVMVAADTNNRGHANWVNRIQCRKRLYITLNEKDIALQASRMKMGEQQRARLGHYLRRLNAENATYIDFTDQDKVDSSHAYFEGKAIKNKKVKNFFQQAFNGEVAESSLRYDVSRNVYSFT